MRRLPLIALALAAGIAVGPAAADDADDVAKMLKGRVAQAPVECLDAGVRNGPAVVGGKLIYSGGSKIWVTEVIGACPGLRGDPLIINEIFTGQLCRNDRFRTMARGTSIPGAYCRIGGFTPYVKVKPPS
jgi:hypothetical protein